ncbi:MAG TPA: RNA polymerase sigma factor [Pseudobdellovibrionaceae bacterium]|jgi:RNA polymerase sigma-70 factor (ECF subfamily)
MISKNEFQKIIEEHQQAVLRLAFFLTKNQAEAKDLTQDVFIKVWEKWDSLGDVTRTLPWILKICRNQFLDNKRHRKYEDSFAKESLAESRHTLPASFEVWSCLLKLEEEERLLLLLVDHQGLSYSETASVLKISEANAKSKIHRARQEFVKIWEEAATLPKPRAS